MENYSNPKEWSDEQIIEYLCSYWNCDDFVFDCTINDKTYKTSHPENFKGSITNITNNSKLICYPYSRYPIFFNILATTKFQFQKGQFKMRFELESRERRESLDNMFMLRPVYSSLYLLNAEKMRVFSQKRAEQGKKEHSSAEKELFEYWGVSDCNFIGYYHYDHENEISIVDDIRKPNFAKIPYYPNDAQKNRFLCIIRAKLRVLFRKTTIFSTGDCLGIIHTILMRFISTSIFSLSQSDLNGLSTSYLPIDITISQRILSHQLTFLTH